MTEVVIIGGCGHVGLPLALAFARAGLDVVSYDLAADKVAATNAGRMPFQDRGADEVLREVLDAGRLRCTTEPAVIADARVVVTVTGTPVDEHLNPRLDAIRALVHQHKERFQRGQLLVIRSTVFPGTTERVGELLRREGLELDLAYCPERVAEGVALEEIGSLPQLVAGCSPRAQQRAEALFGRIASEVVPLEPLAAELAKLFNNAWRYVQFAVANQFFMMANDFDVDFYQVHHAMTHGYPRAEGFPRAGFAAGPCLFKDTMQLAAFHHNHFFLGHAAMLVNEGLPNYVVDRMARRFALGDLTVGVLGMTFKAESDDPRDSLAFKLRRLLEERCRAVLAHDPYLELEGLTALDDLVARADVLVVATPHAVYRDLDVGGKPVVDVWNLHQERLDTL